MVSVIIPVYNEESTIGEVLGSLPNTDDLEVIVADGGSSDRTIEFAQEYPVTIIHSAKNRAVQMNDGAKVAKGDILVFVHADTILEDGSWKAIVKCMGADVVGGCLSQRIDSDRLVFRLIELSGNIRARLSKTFYGDQAIFVRRDVFFRVGGFDTVDLFEDVLFSKKLRAQGKVCVLAPRVHASPRRWQKQGIVRATLINWLVTIGFLLGISPGRLKKIYLDIR